MVSGNAAISEPQEPELRGGDDCYAQDERTVRLGVFECEGGSSAVCLATAASDEE